MAKVSISIAIPAYNEEGNIELAVQYAIRGLKDYFSSYEIIVVNDGSSDKTGEIINRLAATNPNVKALHHAKNQGMGESLHTGFMAATKEYVGSFPGDNGFDVESWGDMLRIVGEADIVSYYLGNPEFRPWYRRTVSWSYVTLLNTVFGLSNHYYNGHAVYRREDIQTLPYLTNGHTFLSECLIRLQKRGLTFKEVPTIQIERKTGKTKAFTARNFRDVFKLLFLLPFDMSRRLPAVQ